MSILLWFPPEGLNYLNSRFSRHANLVTCWFSRCINMISLKNNVQSSFSCLHITSHVLLRQFTTNRISVNQGLRKWETFDWRRHIMRSNINLSSSFELLEAPYSISNKSEYVRILKNSGSTKDWKFSPDPSWKVRRLNTPLEGISFALTNIASYENCFGDIISSKSVSLKSLRMIVLLTN